MRILATVLIYDVALGAAMALYLVLIWNRYKGAVAEHGWNTDCADPICNKMWLLCFVPLLGIVYYLVAGETIGKLCSITKEKANGMVTVSYGPLAFHYAEGE